MLRCKLGLNFIRNFTDSLHLIQRSHIQNIDGIVYKTGAMPLLRAIAAAFFNCPASCYYLNPAYLLISSKPRQHYTEPRQWSAGLAASLTLQHCL